MYTAKDILIMYCIVTMVILVNYCPNIILGVLINHLPYVILAVLFFIMVYKKIITGGDFNILCFQ